MDQLPIELFTLITMQLATEVSFRTFMVSLKALSTTNRKLRQYAISEYLLKFVVNKFSIQTASNVENTSRNLINSLFQVVTVSVYQRKKCGKCVKRCVTVTKICDINIQLNYSEIELRQRVCGLNHSLTLENSDKIVIQKIKSRMISNKLAQLASCSKITY